MVEREIDLAWELASIADAHLAAARRNDVYVALASSEVFAAIDLSIRAVIGNGLAVSSDLVGRLRAWLAAYVGHPDEPTLRRLVMAAETQEAQPNAPTPKPRYLRTVIRHKSRGPRR